MILNRSRDFGIQKALGFTTGQLMVQVALNYTPIVLVVVTVGCLAGFYGFNPLFTMLVHSAGIMSANMPPALLHTICTSLGLTVFAFAMSMLMSWRIRTISPYEMVTN
jgi:putative ABC transport system permease protein